MGRAAHLSQDPPSFPQELALLQRPLGHAGRAWSSCSAQLGWGRGQGGTGMALAGAALPLFLLPELTAPMRVQYPRAFGGAERSSRVPLSPGEPRR